MKNRVDELIFLSNMYGKVINLGYSLDTNILFSLNVADCLKEEKSVYSCLNIALLSLKRGVAFHVCFYLCWKSTIEIEIIVHL